MVTKNQFASLRLMYICLSMYRTYTCHLRSGATSKTCV